MAGPTVIDTLLVKLGLDPRDFTKGAKEAAAAQLDLETKTRRSAENQAGYIGKVAAKWLSVAGAILAIKKVTGVIDDVAERTRRLGIDSRNLGESAAAVRNWENAVEDAGGTAEAARQSINGFNKSIFDLAYNGQMSDSLVMLARLGVQFQDASGKARSFQDIALDTADAIGKAQEAGMQRQDAFQYLQQAGFDSGTAEMLLSGRTNVEASLAKQAQRRQVSGEDFQKATDIRRASIGKDQALEGVKIAGMDFAGGIQENINELIDKLASPGGVNKALGDLADKAKGLGDAFNDFVVKNKPKGRAAYESIIQSAAARHGIPAEILAGVLNTESGFDPAAKNMKSGATGIAQLMPQYFPNAGKNPDDDIRTAAGYLADLEKQAGGNWDLALQMYNAGPGRVRGSMKPGGKPLAQETIDYPEKVFDYMESQATPTPGAQGGGTYNKTDVQIDNITVNTQARDAEGVADNLDGAVKRKLMSAHAETGMQ